jgi:hypothetical protein
MRLEPDGTVRVARFVRLPLPFVDWKGDVMGRTQFGTIMVFPFILVALLAAQQAPSPAGGTDHVAAIKQSLQQSAAGLRQYRWIETTAVSIKGDEKSRTQKSCPTAPTAGAKTPIGSSLSDSSSPGVRGRIVENRRRITGSMQAMAPVKHYVPRTGVSRPPRTRAISDPA